MQIGRSCLYNKKIFLNGERIQFPLIYKPSNKSLFHRNSFLITKLINNKYEDINSPQTIKKSIEYTNFQSFIDKMKVISINFV